MKRLMIAVTAALFAGYAAKAEGEELTEEESRLCPSVEAEIGYRTMKIERGQVENEESVFGYEVELSWLGFFGGIEACYDMTGIDGRRGRYNEIESFLGYRLKLDDFTAEAAYVYKTRAGEEADTQEVEVGLEYELPWFTPFFEIECDTCDNRGALYGSVGVERGWKLAEGVELKTVGGVGFGNSRQNEEDFECAKLAFREIHLGAELELELCPHVKLVPAVGFYDYFTAAQRRVYDKMDGFVVVAGCSLAVEF